MIYFTVGHAGMGVTINNPAVQEDGDPNRWYMEWTINFIPTIRIGYNEDSKDWYRSICLDWLGVRITIHDIRPTELQKQEDI